MVIGPKSMSRIHDNHDFPDVGFISTSSMVHSLNLDIKTLLISGYFNMFNWVFLISINRFRILIQ